MCAATPKPLNDPIVANVLAAAVLGPVPGLLTAPNQATAAPLEQRGSVLFRTL